MALVLFMFFMFTFFMFMFLMLELLVAKMESSVFCVTAFLTLAPSKDSEKSFHWTVQKAAITENPMGRCQLIIQLAPILD